MNINDFGFIRVAAATPKVKVADCEYNIGEIKSIIDQAHQNNVQIVCFPELCITGYTCGDLFFQKTLQEKALAALLDLASYMEDKQSLTAVVGLPVSFKNRLYNMAAVLSEGGIINFVPKIHIPNYNEFYEKRWFSSGEDILGACYKINDEYTDIFSNHTIFKTSCANFAIEICEDLWSASPPSSELAMHGADIILNLSASNELIGKNRYRKSLIAQQSARCNAAYVYSAAGCGESSTDMVFSGASFIAENGVILEESKRFSMENELIIADIDVLALRHERMQKNNSLPQNKEKITEIEIENEPTSFSKLYRFINPHPFIPSEENKDEYLSDAFNIQTHGLAKRISHIGTKTACLGISGGLDSTLALLVTVKTFDLLRIPRKNILGITMPGFGTTNRTYKNAMKLMEALGVTIKEISIVDAVTQHFKDIEHDSNIHDVTYENAQARERTQILMDVANKTGGIVVGTGNLSELALGWATYNGDHMSMYAVNAGVPKTLVASLTRWISDTQLDESAQKVVNDILDTPFSPELLPADNEGKIAQKTEDFVGPYELHDFFLHRMLRYGDEPKRIYFIAQQAFEGMYSSEEILKWLNVFYRRFFAQQFKRSCMPDGPKVGSINLSPRGDWRMPSDAVAKVWLEQLG